MHLNRISYRAFRNAYSCSFCVRLCGLPGVVVDVAPKPNPICFRYTITS